MIFDLTLILTITLCSWWITHFEPLTIMLLSIPSENKFIQKFITLMTCWKCNSFWMGLIICYIFDVNYINAFASSFIAWLISEKILYR